MGKARRTLIVGAISASGRGEFPRRQQERFEACPEAARYSDEEAEDFIYVALCLDRAEYGAMSHILGTAGISAPVEVTFDSYRLGRYLFRRWASPDLREALLGRIVLLGPHSLAQLKRKRNQKEIMQLMELLSPPAALAGLRRSGTPDLVATAKGLMTPEQRSQYQALLHFAKVQMHQFLTEPEPPRRPTRWDHEKLARRLRLRDVQLRSMRKSLHHLRRERQALLARLRQNTMAEQRPELRRLAESLAALQHADVEAERLHAATLAARSAKNQEALATLRAQLADAETQYSRALALRRALVGMNGR